MAPTAIIQVRVGSSRLPCKILKKLNGVTVLDCFFSQLEYSKLLKNKIIATTSNPKDKVIVNFAKEHGFEFFIGSEIDVLDRFYQCAKEFSIKDIVRITPDCPFIDPSVIDKVINFYMQNSFDFVSNTLNRSFPYGNDVEVFSFSSLERSWKEATKQSEREHVTPFIYNNPKLFSISQVVNQDNLTDFHWTLDRNDDLLFIQAIFKRLQKKPIYIDDILTVLKIEPELVKINETTNPTEGYQKSLNDDVF